jgi:hypothetical protein
VALESLSPGNQQKDLSVSSVPFPRHPRRAAQFPRAQVLSLLFQKKVQRLLAGKSRLAADSAEEARMNADTAKFVWLPGA